MKPALSQSRDPVCGMNVAVEQSCHSATHRGLVFHFCSSQCQERFQEYPDYYASQPVANDAPPVLKHRRLRIASGDSTAMTSAGTRIGEMMGVVAVDVADSNLRVEYDLRKTSVAQIEAVGAAAGLVFKGGLHGFRRGFWKFSERNELSNIAHAGTGACCNKPPPRLR